MLQTLRKPHLINVLQLCILYNTKNSCVINALQSSVRNEILVEINGETVLVP